MTKYTTGKFKNTIWIVPPNTLLAYTFNNSTQNSIIDQTIWVIDKVDNGYFFGIAYANVGGTYSKNYLNGSITKNNDVYISFQNNSSIVTGIGKFSDNKFQMQMSTPSKNSNVMHWSFMISVNKNDKYYKKLPGSKTFNNGKYLSVPEFIKNCNSST